MGMGPGRNSGAMKSPAGNSEILLWGTPFRLLGSLEKMCQAKIKSGRLQPITLLAEMSPVCDAQHKVTHLSGIDSELGKR